LDFAVAQNGAALKVYHNQRGAPGVRVTLAGRGPNPQAIGTRFRFVGRNGAGPMHELHSGTGYLSQDSLTAVLRVPEAGEIHVWWPDGSESATPVTPEMRELRIAQPAR
jgi:hypothetical protein